MSKSKLNFGVYDIKKSTFHKSKHPTDKGRYWKNSNI